MLAEALEGYPPSRRPAGGYQMSDGEYPSLVGEISPTDPARAESGFFVCPKTA